MAAQWHTPWRWQWVLCSVAGVVAADSAGVSVTWGRPVAAQRSSGVGDEAHAWFSTLTNASGLRLLNVQLAGDDNTSCVALSARGAPCNKILARPPGAADWAPLATGGGASRRPWSNFPAGRSTIYGSSRRRKSGLQE